MPNIKAMFRLSHVLTDPFPNRGMSVCNQGLNLDVILLKKLHTSD